MSAVRTIAVGFDGSPDAERALRWAQTLGHQLGATVVVVHAVGLLEHATQPSETPALEAAVRRIEQEGGTPIRWQLADGDPVSVLRRVGEDHQADLLVVGSRGRGARAGLLLGSTSLELAERALLPVVIVPGGDERVASELSP